MQRFGIQCDRQSGRVFWKNNDSFGKYADNYNIVGDYQQYYEKVEEGYVR